MTGVVEMLLAASLVCGAASLCLVLLPHAPPRVRFRIAFAGLAAWAVPWPLIDVPIDVPLPAAVVEWRGAHETADGVSIDRPVDAAPQPLPRFAVPAALALLFLPGVLVFVRDAAALRASLRAWRAASRSGEALRARVPEEFRGVRASIRIVPGSATAAASGWLRPVVWLGERLSDRERDVALVHELSHVRSRDPFWITLVTVSRRAYWWNPAVAWLAREAVLALEADCDRRCARWLGVEPYVERLAAMMLDAATSPPSRLLAHARTPSLNVQRLKLLQQPARRMRVRDHALVAIVRSDPLRIEYVAEDRVGGTRRQGVLEVVERDTTRIARLEVREVGDAREDRR
ncbi:MAG TPA: M56 family metallopeptidase [Gammaproteobacteria bacterium]